MRCRKCGFDNPENADVCQNCSAPLIAEVADVETEDTDRWGFLNASRHNQNDDGISEDDFNALERSFWPSADDYNVTQSSPELQAKKKKSLGARRTDVKSDARKDSALSDASDYNTEYNRNARSDYENTEYEENDYYDDYNENSYEEYERPAQVTRAAGRNVGAARRKLDFRKILVACLVVVMLAVVIILLIKIKSCNKTNPEAKDIDGEITLNEESPGNYYVKAWRKPGTVLVYENSAGQRQEAKVSKRGYVIFTVPVAALLPVEPIDSDTYEATPVIYAKNEDDGSLEQLEMPSVSVEVPKLNLTCENQAEFECENGMCLIKGRIEQTTAGVFINGEPVALNADGAFEKELRFDAAGTFDVLIEAKLGGHKIERIQLKTTVTQPPDPGEIIQIADGLATRAKNSDESIVVSGKVPVGTQIEVKSDDPEFSLKTEPSVDTEGNFSFEVNLPKAAKNYEMTIAATLGGGAVVERPFCVQRPPIFSEFVQRCWAFNYSEISKPAWFNRQQFEIEGTVSEIIEDGDCLKAKLTVASGETMIIVYYNHYSGASVLTVGQKYLMYGIPMSKDANGNVEVFIWFVHD